VKVRPVQISVPFLAPSHQHGRRFVVASPTLAGHTVRLTQASGRVILDAKMFSAALSARAEERDFVFANAVTSTSCLCP
jgi:hypothetical protein